MLLDSEMITSAETFEVATLEYASPETVYDWLKRHPIDYRVRPRWAQGRDIDATLYERNESLIHLGLAIYGVSPEIQDALILSENEHIRLSMYIGLNVTRRADEKIWMDSKISQMVNDFMTGEWTELVLLLKNEYVPDDILVDLFLARRNFQAISSEPYYWVKAISIVASNKRIRSPYSSPIHDNESIDEMRRYNEVFYTAWRLLERIEPNVHTDRGLLQLLRALAPAWKLRIPDWSREVSCPDDPANAIDPSYTPPINVQAQLKKWVDPAIEEARHQQGALASFVAVEESSFYIELRSHIIKLMPPKKEIFDVLAANHDKGQRLGAYRYHPKPSMDLIYLAVSEDATDGLNALLENHEIFKKKELRDLLKKVIWQQKMDDSNSGSNGYRLVARSYTHKEEHYRVCYPNCFDK